MNIPAIVFADTNFYVAGLNKKDPYRPRAAKWFRALQSNNSKIVTTEAVLWEWLNSCSPRATRITAIGGYDRLHNDPRVGIVGFEPALVEGAMELYRSHADKEWGIVDCFSFTVMRERRISAALTADHHFEQAGFMALLLADPPA